jgi:hypothetical protein
VILAELQSAERSSAHRSHDAPQRCQADIRANSNAGAVGQGDLDPSCFGRSRYLSRPWNYDQESEAFPPDASGDGAQRR